MENSGDSFKPVIIPEKVGSADAGILEFKSANTNSALFNSLDPKLKKVGDAVSFSLKEGVNPREVRGPAIRYKITEKGRDGEWDTFWDEEEKKIYVEKVK